MTPSPSFADTPLRQAIRTGAVGGAIASLLEPLVSTILAVIVLHERMSWLGVLGMVSEIA